ncbi:EF-hand domain-containing protein [Bdellovibrio sp. SKB1291214]|uniref:calcium-binding protein n=1 Tax=Bdellovibrio sp. SKB1291214 TaxID=1732569 RepID=UPI000B51767E|nr:calcium-binding protein [Bdellovibrio sp. SKB1291214]UYL08330.1 EF-hand domain-containing protein [Bdellovibrio sp. SKB1291214]
MKSTFVFGTAVALLSSSAFAVDQSNVISRDVPMAVNSVSSGESVVGAPSSGTVTRSGRSTMTVRLVNSCFPTNLRAVTNPLARSSLVTADINLLIGSHTYNLKAEYPANIVGDRPQNPLQVFTGTVTNMKSSKYKMTPEGGTVSMYGNVVEFKTLIPTGVSVDDSATITVSKENVALGAMKFEQEILDCNTGPVWGEYGYSSKIPTYGCADFMGKDGDISATIAGFNVSPDRSLAEIFISFPGETGFCGGYWSPLMVFFDDKLPKFDNVSSFPLNPDGKTYWPNKNGPGFFLSLDRDKNGKIDKKDELFGNTAQFDNGFDALKELDTNKDGIIDAKDKDFKNLVLWNDKNGDGISQKTEMTRARLKLDKIELNYENIHQTVGANAELRQRSKFHYTDAQGKKKTGIVYDVWISPYIAPSLAATK